MKSDIRKDIQSISLPVRASVREAMRVIDRGGLGAALLIEDNIGKFKGLVTDGDIRRALLSGHGLESPVAAIPRPEAKTVRVGMSVDEIMQVLDERVRVVPVLDQEEKVVDLVFFDRRMRLPVAAPSLGERELLYVTECVLTGWISSAGEFVTRFEEMFAAFCGTRYGVATSNGTAALHLALLSVGVGPGDEVIIPTLTFIAVANAVTYTGARPVFVDSEPETWNINPGLIEQAVTSRTKAIIPVHLYGHPADMDPILEIASRHGLTVIEDGAEAHGARYKGRRVGGIGDLGAFSFYGNKIITTGEGGMVTTNRADLANKIRLLRDHGMSSERRYWHPILGYNYRLTNLQAAVGVAQMERVDVILNEKQRIARAYTDALAAVGGIQLPPHLEWADNVYWLYSILVEPGIFGWTRDELMARLKEKEIETRPLFPPIHTQPIYATGENLPVAEHLAVVGLSLPSAVGLKLEDIAWVADVITYLKREAA